MAMKTRFIAWAKGLPLSTKLAALFVAFVLVHLVTGPDPIPVMSTDYPCHSGCDDPRIDGGQP